MPRRVLKRLHGSRAQEIQAAGLGSNWKEFLAKLRQLRVAGHVLANSEVDRGRFGIAVPVLSGERNAIGSLSFVLETKNADERTVNRLAPMVMAAAREIERAMQDAAKESSPVAAFKERKLATKSKRRVKPHRKTARR
jgi:DNA-binding IclR family transcriptional regulator